MAASPVPRPDPGPGAPSRAPSLTEWLRARDDRALAGLLRLRPDLALPAAPDLAALAARIGVRTSTQRSVDGLDARELRVLEELVLAAGPDDTVVDAVPQVVPADDPDGRAALDALLDRVLVWGDPELLHLTPAVRDVVGPYPAGLGRPAALLRAPAAAALAADPDRLAATLAGLDDADLAVLDRLSAGPPVGTVRDPGASPAQRLVEQGLLAAIDAQRVELPREVGLAVRAARHTLPRPEAPPVRVVERDPLELDRAGTTAVLDTLRLAESIADAWSAQPPPTLRSGGLGVRELRRTARDLGVDEPTAALLVETLYAAGLLNATLGPEPVYLPTPDFDQWRDRDAAARWLVLATAWLGMTRQPDLVGRRGDRDRVLTALSPDVERGTVPALRRQALGLLAELPPGAAPADRDDVLARFAWRQPRRATGQLPVVTAILAEAELLGVTAAGGVTGWTRTLLADRAATSPAATTMPAAAMSTATTTAAEHALDRALPEPVDHVLVQPDLTVVVPGPPVAELGAELALLADLESTGGASVYRITEASVRRALDAGRSGTQLEAFVAARSRTPVPQALTYLIEDAARRHGILRAGTAGAYLRCEDVALLDRVVADRGTSSLGLRRLAPTVAVTGASVSGLLDTLRAAGFAPAAESPDGEVITLGTEPPRAPSRPAGRGSTVRAAIDPDAQAAELVRRLRAGDAQAAVHERVSALVRDIPGVSSAATMETLRQAVREARLVSFGAAEADGSTSAHLLQPISLAAGTVRGYERGRTGLASYPVHRITAVRLLDEDEAAELRDTP